MLSFSVNKVELKVLRYHVGSEPRICPLNKNTYPWPRQTRTRIASAPRALARWWWSLTARSRVSLGAFTWMTEQLSMLHFWLIPVTALWSPDLLGTLAGASSLASRWTSLLIAEPQKRAPSLPSCQAPAPLMSVPQGSVLIVSASLLATVVPITHQGMVSSTATPFSSGAFQLVCKCTFLVRN